MKQKSSPEETIVRNFELFKTQLTKLGPKAGKLPEWLEENAQRIMLAPASTRLDYTCAHPGGLVEHSLRVLKTAAQLRQALQPQTSEISVESLLLCSLLHDIGKVGTSTKDYYLTNDSEWHRNNLGIYYKVAEPLQHLPVAQLSLKTLADLGVQVDLDEWYAIASIGNSKLMDSDIPTTGAPLLSVLLIQAVKFACLQGKGKREVEQIL